MARYSDIKAYINYIDKKIIQDFEANERALKELERLKPCYKAYNENLKKLEELEKKEKIKKISVIDKNLKEIIKLKKEELREIIEKKYKNIAVRKQFIEIEEIKSYYLSDQERYKLHFYGVSEELGGKHPELIEILKIVLTEKKEVKQCFNCGSIEPISEYQKNGKTPRGRQKYRQECRECRQERREKERENREKQKIKDQEAREEREREAERRRERRREPKKICRVCGKKKPISEYQKNGKTPKGRQKYRQECRECRQERREKERENREKQKIKDQEAREERERGF